MGQGKSVDNTDNGESKEGINQGKSFGSPKDYPDKFLTSRKSGVISVAAVYKDVSGDGNQRQVIGSRIKFDDKVAFWDWEISAPNFAVQEGVHVTARFKYRLNRNKWSAHEVELDMERTQASRTERKKREIRDEAERKIEERNFMRKMEWVYNLSGHRVTPDMIKNQDKRIADALYEQLINLAKEETITLTDQMHSLQQEFKRQKTMKVVFMIDVTSSMQDSIDYCKDGVCKVMKNFEEGKLYGQQYVDMKVKFAFVGYRDVKGCEVTSSVRPGYFGENEPVDNRIAYEPEEPVVFHDFCTATELSEFLTTVKANGGGDVCEDGCQGYDQCTKLTYTDEDGFTGAGTIVVHVMDSPFHGEYFHNHYSDEWVVQHCCPPELLAIMALKEITGLAHLPGDLGDIGEVKNVQDLFDKSPNFDPDGKITRGLLHDLYEKSKMLEYWLVRIDNDNLNDLSEQRIKQFLLEKDPDFKFTSSRWKRGSGDFILGNEDQKGLGDIMLDSLDSRLSPSEASFQLSMKASREGKKEILDKLIQKARETWEKVATPEQIAKQIRKIEESFEEMLNSGFENSFERRASQGPDSLPEGMVLVDLELHELTSPREWRDLLKVQGTKWMSPEDRKLEENQELKKIVMVQTLNIVDADEKNLKPDGEGFNKVDQGSFRHAWDAWEVVSRTQSSRRWKLKTTKTYDMKRKELVAVRDNTTSTREEKESAKKELLEIRELERDEVLADIDAHITARFLTAKFRKEKGAVLQSNRLDYGKLPDTFIQYPSRVYMVRFEHWETREIAYGMLEPYFPAVGGWQWWTDNNGGECSPQSPQYSMTINALSHWSLVRSSEIFVRARLEELQEELYDLKAKGATLERISLCENSIKELEQLLGDKWDQNELWCESKRAVTPVTLSTRRRLSLLLVDLEGVVYEELTEKRFCLSDPAIHVYNNGDDEKFTGRFGRTNRGVDGAFDQFAQKHRCNKLCEALGLARTSTKSVSDVIRDFSEDPSNVQVSAKDIPLVTYPKKQKNADDK